MSTDRDALRKNLDHVIAQSHELIRTFHQLQAERQLIGLRNDSRRVEQQILRLLRRAGVEGLEA